jgi:hypothetical protein
MAGPIPEAWRKDVVRILHSNDPRLIEWTPQALQRWEDDTYGGAQEPDAYDAMIAALEHDDVTGNETTSYPGQVATWEFLFPFRTRTMYGKIALKKDRLRILILSAHKAQRQTL